MLKKFQFVENGWIKIIYSNTLRIFWLDLNRNKSTPVEFSGTILIINLDGKIGLVNNEMTIRKNIYRQRIRK